MAGKVLLRFITVGFALAFLAGCGSAHNPMTFKSYQTTPVAGATSYPASNGKVWVTTDDLPKNVKYKVIEEVDVGSHWYGPATKLNPLFAKLGRKAGANAIILVKTWHQPSGFSWSAPQGHGVAVKIIEPKDFDFTTLSGGWY